MATFSFNGISNTDMSAKLLEMSLPVRASCAQQSATVPGRAEPLMKTGKEYSSTQTLIKMELQKSANVHDIFKWLSGSGRLIRSDYPDRYYTVSSCGLLSSDRLNGSYRSITVSFESLPFAYATSNDPISFSASPADFCTIGTIYSEPVIKLYGDGDITICVNGNYLTIEAVEGYCTIDVPRRVLHKDGVSILTQSIGALTKLLLVPDPLAHNHITFTPTCTGIEVAKNERWL